MLVSNSLGLTQIFKPALEFWNTPFTWFTENLCRKWKFKGYIVYGISKIFISSFNVLTASNHRIANYWRTVKRHKSHTFEGNPKRCYWTIGTILMDSTSPFLRLLLMASLSYILLSTLFYFHGSDFLFCQRLCTCLFVLWWELLPRTQICINLFFFIIFFCQITQFLESQGFLDYVERCLNSELSGHNLLDKLQDATGRGQNLSSIFPPPLEEPEIITITQPDAGDAGAHYRYERFPSNIRTEEQEEKRRAILASASGSLSGRYTPRCEGMCLFPQFTVWDEICRNIEFCNPLASRFLLFWWLDLFISFIFSSPSVVGIDLKAESLSPRERAVSFLCFHCLAWYFLMCLRTSIESFNGFMCMICRRRGNEWSWI